MFFPKAVCKQAAFVIAGGFPKEKTGKTRLMLDVPGKNTIFAALNCACDAPSLRGRFDESGCKIYRKGQNNGKTNKI